VIRSSVTISLVPSLWGGPWIYWDDLEISLAKAKAAGFDAVELFTASADAVNPDALSRLLAQQGLELAAVGTGAGRVLHGLHLTSPDGRIRRAARDFISAMIDFGCRLGAPAIIGSMQGRLERGVERAQALEWLAESLAVLGQEAAAHGVKLIYEPLNRYETDLTNSLDDGVALIESLGRGNVCLLADLFHMNIEEESVAGAIRAAGEHIGYVHFVDSNRRPAGLGHLDLGEVGRALREVGFQGYASAEALPYPNPDAAAAQTMAAFKEFLAPAVG